MYRRVNSMCPLARCARRKIELLIPEMAHRAQTRPAGKESEAVEARRCRRSERGMKARKRKQKVSKGRAHDRGLFLIAIFKLFKVALLVAAAVGAFSLLHKNV